MSKPWFYPDRVSARHGEIVRIYASGPVPSVTLTVTHLGASETVVAIFENIRIEGAPMPDDADANGCAWPEVFSFEIAPDWPNGYLDLRMTDTTGASTRHFVVARPSTPQARALLILSTNTWASYNYWGGANSYAAVEDLMAGRVDADGSRPGAIGRLSRLRPYPQLQLAPPEDVPRLINLTPRAPGALALPGRADYHRAHRPSPYDGAAGYVNKWEHKFVAWCERNNVELDIATDHDFETEPDLLDTYRCAILVGHSEYWSGTQRAAVERFVDAGGGLAVFSGNTSYWKVRWEDDGETLVAHKWRGESDDPLWNDPERQSEATHLWSHESFGAPEASLFGLSFLYGGYHRLCMCASRGGAAYTVYDDKHWALAGSDLWYGDQFGGDVPLIGYENDGVPITFGADGLPKADGGLGVPENLEIIALAPATLAESPDSPYPPMIPREMPDVLARIAWGDVDAVDRLMRGHAVMASFRRGKGEVFNGGTTEWAHGLAAGDPFVEQITRNVLTRFGAIGPEPEQGV